VGNPSIVIAILVMAFAGALVVGLLVPAYNRFVALRNRADQAFATVDVMLKRRYDLVPNLVACVTGSLKHERETLAEVTALRTKAMASGLSQDDTLDFGRQAGRHLSRIMVAVEGYPQLRASENFLQLQRSLNEVEEQLAAARRAFNAAITEYNNAVLMFPGNVVARIFGFTLRRLFEAGEPERAAPDVHATLKTE
jgi:LemA protein